MCRIPVDVRSAALWQHNSAISTIPNPINPRVTKEASGYLGTQGQLGIAIEMR